MSYMESENRKTRNWRIRMWEIFKHKSVKFERKFNYMNKVMDIEKPSKFNLLKKEVEETEY